MSITITPAAPSPALAARVTRIKVADYDRLIASGLIPNGEKTELVEGLVIDKKSRNRPHIQAVNRGLEALTRMLPACWHAAKGDPVAIPDWSKPEPDLAVVRGAIEDYDDRDVAAADVALVVEVADSSLVVDQVEKARVYSQGGIPAYWIVNLPARRIEVYSDPGPDGYRTVQPFEPGDHVPVVLDGSSAGAIAVVDVVPPHRDPP